MLDYMKYTQSPDRQLMAETLRGTVASGGTPAVAPSTAMSNATVGNQQVWGNSVAQQQQQGADLSSMAKMGGKWLSQPSGTAGQNNLQAGLKSLSGMFGGGTTGADIGAGASQYGPEVSKMGGTVTGSGGGFMDRIGSMFGGGSSPGFGGGYSAGYAAADSAVGDKFYGKQAGSDEYKSDSGKAAAKQALTTAAYSNPYTAAALWADRLLFDGKGMDKISGLFS